MNINQKINAKGNSLVFYSNAASRVGKLIKSDYKWPNQNINLPYKLILASEYMSNIKGH